jgi:hypothetical protein
MLRRLGVTGWECHVRSLRGRALLHCWIRHLLGVCRWQVLPYHELDVHQLFGTAGKWVPDQLAFGAWRALLCGSVWPRRRDTVYAVS